MTANSFTSVSLDPPLVLVCVDHRAKMLQTFQRAERFGINVLSEGQRDLSQRSRAAARTVSTASNGKPAKAACRCFLARWRGSSAAG